MTLLGRGSLSAGYYQEIPYVLTASVPYMLTVSSDDPTVIYDLDLFDENGHMVATSPVEGPIAMCQVTPAWTGSFVVRVTGRRGTGMFSLISEP